MNGGPGTTLAGPFNADQRRELREAIDQSKREAIAESRSRVKSPVVRAAEKAHRAQDAKPLMEAIVVAEPLRDPFHCSFCGGPAKDGVCHAHSNLVEAAL